MCHADRDRGIEITITIYPEFSTVVTPRFGFVRLDSRGGRLDRPADKRRSMERFSESIDRMESGFFLAKNLVFCVDHGTVLTEKWSFDRTAVLADPFHHLEFFIKYLCKFVDFLFVGEKVDKAMFESREISLRDRPGDRIHAYIVSLD